MSAEVGPDAHTKRRQIARDRQRRYRAKRRSVLFRTLLKQYKALQARKGSLAEPLESERPQEYIVNIKPDSRADIMIKARPPSKRRYDHIIFEEPLINISMEPTEEVDPLFIDPTAESIDDEDIGEFTINGLSIFSPKVGDFKQKTISCKSPEKKPPKIKIKQEIDSELGVKIKEEPKDCEDDFEMDLIEPMEQEEDIDPVEELAKALDQVEYLCPKCTFRSTDKEEVSHHFVSSHRVCQIGIPRPCDKCDFVGKTVRELSAHKKQKHPRTIYQYSLPSLPTGEYKCPHCEFNSFHRNNVRAHMKVHTQDTVYTCDKCPYTAINKLNIENHAARHLMKPKNKKKWKYQCKHCGLWERTEKLLQRHLILHGEGEMLKCQLCPYKSPYSHIITMHTRICHGIITSKNDENDRWKSRRTSTRTCTRDKKNYNEEKVEDFYENVPKRPYRRNKQEVGSKDDDSKDNSKSDLNENTPADEKDKPMRPTLEERLGRARDLLSKTLPSKKDKDSERDDLNKDKNEDGKESSEDEDQSEGFEGEKSDDDWSEGESEFDDGTEDESIQSSTSDRQTIDSATKDNENSNTDSDLFKSKSLSIKENSNDSFKSNKSKGCHPLKNKNEDKSSCKLSDNKDKDTDEDMSKDNENKEMSTNENSNDSGPAVLVLKRKGTSFTSFLKNNSDSS